jgi:hypothetical protein
VGRKFAILGYESGTFEAWAYPLKLLRNFELSFFLGSSTRAIPGKEIVQYASVSPEATVLTYTYQSFTVKAIFVTPVEESGAFILLDVRSIEPLTIVCGFIPVLQPMWPAGIGGQYAYWNKELKAYLISESSGHNHGLIGSPAASGISYTPAHMLSDVPQEFRIEIQKPSSMRNKFIPIYIAGGKGPREQIVKVYKDLQQDPENLYHKNVAHYEDLRKKTLRVQTPDMNINLAFEWAKVVYDNLVVHNPDLGYGLVAGLGASGTSGRPGFGWFFGGDAFINCLSLNSTCNYQMVKEILRFNQKWQRQDGKMAHELSQAAGYIDWWKDYHFGYIHGDTTPFYIVAMFDYYILTGDTEFIKRSWDSLERAFEWCLRTDANQDGLMDNKKAGLGALEYGVLTGIETDVYLAAVWTRAAYAMQILSELVGENLLVEKASETHRKAKKAFNEKFWDDEDQMYVYAFNSEGKLVKEVSPWSAVGMMWGFGTNERSRLTLERMSSSELTTDWGIRSISTKSKFYQPLNYNYGAVWPFITSWATTALFKRHLPQQGYSSLMSTVFHTFDHALGCLTEVFSGSQNIWPQEAVSQQGFSSAGVVLPLVRGLLGLKGNTVERIITFAPHFPADWKEVSIDNFKIGDSVFSFKYKRDKGRIQVTLVGKNSNGYSLHLKPVIGVGCNITSIKADGKTFPFKQKRAKQVVQAEARLPLSEGKINIEINFNSNVEILPAVVKPRVGDINSGLKIISFFMKDNHLNVKIEGLANKIYSLRIMNPEFIKSVMGAELDGDRLRVKMSQGEEGKFLTHSIVIKLKE